MKLGEKWMIERGVSTAQAALETASSTIHATWKRDVREGPMPLKARAFAGILDPVANGNSNQVLESSTSFTGSICTEFTLLFDPASSLVDGRSGKLQTVTGNAEAQEISRRGTVKKQRIASRVTANRQARFSLGSSSSAAAEIGGGTDNANQAAKAATTDSVFLPATGEISTSHFVDNNVSDSNPLLRHKTVSKKSTISASFPFREFSEVRNLDSIR